MCLNSSYLKLVKAIQKPHSAGWPQGDLRLLQISPEVRILAQVFIEDHALPAKAEADAYHIAIAVVNGIEYLLTWNCTHIANAHTRPKIEATCRAHGYEPPVICTPLELIEE